MRASGLRGQAASGSQRNRGGVTDSEGAAPRIASVSTKDGAAKGVAWTKVVLFGSSRLAGLGKSAGKSVREFKEELHKDDEQPAEKTAADADAADDKK